MSKKRKNKKWERRPGETKKDYYYFQQYIDLGYDRSITKLSKKCNKSTSLLYKRCRKWDWVKRADAYDEYLLDEGRKSTIKTYKKFVQKKIKNKIKTSETYDKLATEIYEDFKLNSKDKAKALNDLSVADVNNDKVLNNYTGNPSERIEHSGELVNKTNVKVETGFDDDEREYIKEIAKSIARRPNIESSSEHNS